MTHARQSAVFGKRAEPHTIIIARGNQIRHFTVRPWLAALVGSALCAVAIGYLLATSYLVLRDDLIGATVAHQARMQQAYEDRISVLRAQVDHITSRQLLDQQIMERKVGELLERQAQLSERHGRIDPILERAAKRGDDRDAPVPVPTPRPDIRAGFDSKGGRLTEELATLTAYTERQTSDIPWPLRDGEAVSTADRADRLFAEIRKSLRTIESEQLVRLDSLTDNTFEAVDTIAAALESAGMPVDEDYGEEGVGGPLVAHDDSLVFETRVRVLDEALSKLESLKSEAARLPIRNPAPGHAVSSGFGERLDPFLKKTAHHSGMDFRAKRGSSVRATGAGTVTAAGWSGGYGRMVEIDHGDGFTSRYAHLAKISITKGQSVEAGAVLGEAGSSGRSTGPHLHYEIRRDGNAVDPLSFLEAGRKVKRFL